MTQLEYLQIQFEKLREEQLLFQRICCMVIFFNFLVNCTVAGSSVSPFPFCFLLFLAKLLTWILCYTGDLRGSSCWLALNAGVCVCKVRTIACVLLIDFEILISALFSPGTISFFFFLYKSECISRKNLGLSKVCSLKGEMCLFELQCSV